MLQIATIRFTCNLISENLTKTVENSICYFGSVKWNSLPTELRKKILKQQFANGNQ